MNCGNHRGIKLTNTVSKLLNSVIIKHPNKLREEKTRNKQACFRPGRECIDQIFALFQILGHRHTLSSSTMIVQLDLKAAFDSVDQRFCGSV